MAHQPLGIGVVGAGNIVKRHGLAYRSLPQLARLVAVADLDQGRAEAARQRYGFERTFGDYKDLLACSEVDAVSICAPAGAHAQMVMDSIRAGKHVLCEKPFTTTLADADEVVRVAEQHPGQTVSCVFQLRNDATFQRMRWLIEQGHIGRVLLAKACVRLRKTPAYFTSAPGRGTFATDGGGVVINQAIHQVDALLSFLGNPVEVSAVKDTFVHPIESEDTLVGWVRFEGGAIASIEFTTCAKKKEFSIDIVGERAGMRVAGDPDSQNFTWRVDAAGSAAKKAVQSAGFKKYPEPRKPGGLTESVQKIAAKIKRRDRLPPLHWGHTPFVREFLEAAQARVPGPVPPREARRSVELTTALYEAATSGRTVKIPLDSKSALYHGVVKKEQPPVTKAVEAVVG